MTCNKILHFDKENTLVHAAEGSIMVQNIEEEITKEILDSDEKCIV